MTRTPDSNLLLSPPANALNRFYDYFIKEQEGDPIPFGSQEKWETAIEALGGTAGIYYWPSADAYAKDKAPWLRWSLVSGNMSVGVLFLINAVDGLVNTSQLEMKAPSVLKDLIELPPQKALLALYTKIMIGSLVCSIPFGIAAYLYPLPGCDSSACLGTIVTHSLLSNTILHAISWKLMLDPENWIYRAPLVPIEKALQLYRHCRMTQEQKQLALLEQTKKDIYQKYRDHLSQFFTKSAEKIVNDYLATDYQRSTDAIAYLHNMKKSESSIFSFTKLAQNDETKTIMTLKQPRSRVWCLCSAAHQLLLKGGISAIGAAFITLGCIGWVADPFYLGLQEGLTIPETVGAGILPAYSMGVLLAFYGASCFKQIYQYLTSWNSLGNKFPIEAKLYPKTFTLFLLITAYAAFFSYATAQELILTIFGDEMWDAYRPFLQALAYPALQILDFVPLIALFSTLIKKSVAKFGSETDHKLACRLLVKSEILSQRLQQINGSALMASLEQHTPEQQTYLGINPNKLYTDIKKLTELDKESLILQAAPKFSIHKRSDRCFSTLWRSGRNENSAPLLINQSGEDSWTHMDSNFV